MRLIDADALKFYGNHIGDEYEDKFHDSQWVSRNDIDSGPTIDAVSVVHGEWKVSCKDSVCSVCGKDEAEFICGTEDWYGYGLSNFCPNCGAKMKGADDKKECHKPESQYYRAYCEEWKDEIYCEGCKFWY